MSESSLGGRPFRLDPDSITWPFTVLTRTDETIGGRVVQVFGARLGDITVTGSFGTGGWEEQTSFLATMQYFAEVSLIDPKSSPLRFLWPSRNWDFLVYIKSYTNPDGDRSVTYHNEIANPRWTLTLFVVEDNTGIRRVAQDAFIQRLSAGLGWKRTEFQGHQGPTAYAEVEAFLKSEGASTIDELVGAEFGVSATVPTGNSDNSG